MAEASTSASAIQAPSTSASAKINGDVVEVTLDSIEDALQAVRDGEILVVVDDMDRENEGDLIIAASKCTTEKMAWIVKWSRWVGRDGRKKRHAHGWASDRHFCSSARICNGAPSASGAIDAH